ncbi:MAG: ATP-binding protein, partial [Methyloprofundus sp.]|nr:ATP-binding protein [Methyloprofundus sp.]
MSNQGSKEDNNESLISQINKAKGTGEISKTKLETDEKVLARVTDGIYRLPGSALRELISNAYDADADNVIIDTDVPRFENMTIRDDGNGMSIDTLVNLIGHIGGSAKRNEQGKKLAVTDALDSTLSLNKKRKLIGKIGIGLFSVAQLTRDFEIITKQEGNDFYLKARVRLFNYSDEYIREQEKNSTAERGASFETGNVEIWTESTTNISAHGTDIILRNIKKSASDQLKSCDIWGQEAAETNSNIGSDDFLNSGSSETPSFHMGFLSGSGGYEYFDTGKGRQPK